MPDTTDPSFADVFGNDLLDDNDESGAEPSLDPTTVFIEDDGSVVGTHIDDGGRTERFDGDRSELAPAGLRQSRG